MPLCQDDRFHPKGRQTMRMAQIGVLAGLTFAHAHGQTSCVSFPGGFISFSSISYVTAADLAGDHPVAGVPAPGALNFVSANLAAPATTNLTPGNQVPVIISAGGKSRSRSIYTAIH
jgi:hypothetical protein